ncbi:hypothetical protein EDC04DRAFT_2624962 [Pisolithus marmoratus]|nr:hypothetical protein EDC04DRAFT_2624962 [Pisolithus marmoratus]
MIASATSPSGNIEDENGALSDRRYWSTSNHSPDHVSYTTNYAELQAIGHPSRYQQENWNVSTFGYPFRFYNSTNATVSHFSNTSRPSIFAPCLTPDTVCFNCNSAKLNLFLHRSHKHCRRSHACIDYSLSVPSDHRLAYVLDDQVGITSNMVDDYGSFDANEGNSGKFSALTPRCRALCHQTRPCLLLKSCTSPTALVAKAPEYLHIRQPLSAPL